MTIQALRLPDQVQCEHCGRRQLNLKAVNAWAYPCLRNGCSSIYGRYN